MLLRHPARPLRAPRGLSSRRLTIAPRAAIDDPCPVAAELARTLLADPSLAPPPASPSPLLPPAAVAAAVVTALWRPDTPDVGDGVRTAFLFTLPADVGVGAPVAPTSGRRARAWHATEAWLTYDQFAAHVTNDPPAAWLATAADVALVGATAFGGRGGRTAVQAVDVACAGGVPRRISVIMTRVDEGGPWAKCYLVTGLRQGDYS